MLFSFPSFVTVPRATPLEVVACMDVGDTVSRVEPRPVLLSAHMGAQVRQS